MAEHSPPLFDIGANLIDKQLINNFDDIILESKKNDVDKIIITASNLNDTKKAKILIDREPELLFTTVGFHPHNAKDYKEIYFNEMLNLCKMDYVKAIGECGLDYTRF